MFTSWVHGIAVIVQNPVEGLTDKRYSDEGAIISQPAGTENWFHIPVSHSLGEARLMGVHIDAFTDKGVLIDRIHVRDQGRLPGQVDVSLSGGEHSEFYRFRNVRTYKGYCVSLHVKFLENSENGRVIFRGVGIDYDQP